MTPRSRLRIEVERKLLLVAGLVMALAGCEDRAAPFTSGDPPPELSGYVTGIAAQSIDGQGFFQLAKPAAPGEAPIISPERAAQLAQAYLKTWKDVLRPVLENDRGGSIAFDHLQVGRVFFARTPFGPVPDGFHPVYRNVYGPQYLVTMVAGGNPVLIISVAAHASYVRIDERGYLLPSRRSGGEFDHTAIARTSRSGSRYLPNLPEQAVERVGRATGARASHVPELVMRADPWQSDNTRSGAHPPAYALWRVRLDREVAVRGLRQGGRQGRVRELMVGPFDQLLIPAERQLSTERIEARLLGDSISEGGVGVLQIPILEPIAYEAVVIETPEMPQ